MLESWRPTVSTGHTQEVTAMRRNRPITAVVSFGSVAIAALHFHMVLAVVGLIVLLLCIGVILPAVWSRRPARRRDARAVLQQLLGLFEPACSDAIVKPTCVAPDEGECPTAGGRSANRSRVYFRKLRP
jgi:hypothetical protein